MGVRHEGPHPHGPLAERGPLISPAIYQRYVQDLCDGNRAACRATVEGLIAEGTPVRDLYRHLFHESLYEVGHRWEVGAATVATEHIATAITESLIALCFSHAVARPTLARRAVVSCAADEFHQIGGRIVADVLELRGWSVGFVGANLPLDALLAEAKKQRPHLVGISVTLVEHLDNGQRAVEALRRAGCEAPIVLGGAAIAKLPPEWAARQAGLHVCETLEALEALLPALEGTGRGVRAEPT